MMLDNIQSTEESQVAELRRRFKGHMREELYEDDNMFVRFLRARSHNIDAAEAMLRNHLNWRKQCKIDTLLTEYNPHEFMKTEYFPMSRLGTDLENAPLSYMPFGQLDTRGLLKTVSKHDISMYVAYYLETDMAAMKLQTIQTGKLLDKCVYILNFENFSLGTATHKATLETVGAIITMYEGNFPERLKTAYVINVSYYFTIFWAVIKQFLSPATAEKIKIYGKSGWQEKLQQYISPDVLPAFLGGNRTDPDGDPTCKSIIKYGGPIPEKYFNPVNQSRIPGAVKLHVNRMSKAGVAFQVLHPGSTLEWEFIVKNRDIVFSVFFKESSSDDSNAKEVIPQQKVEASALSECGMYLCEKKGIYVIEFDNTYSWIHNKEIYYKASVVTPHSGNNKGA